MAVDVALAVVLLVECLGAVRAGPGAHGALAHHVVDAAAVRGQAAPRRTPQPTRLTHVHHARTCGASMEGDIITNGEIWIKAPQFVDIQGATLTFLTTSLSGKIKV
jgi:hypothetical protein